jgi:hypothetical protein
VAPTSQDFGGCKTNDTILTESNQPSISIYHFKYASCRFVGSIVDVVEHIPRPIIRLFMWLKSGVYPHTSPHWNSMCCPILTCVTPTTYLNYSRNDSLTNDGRHEVSNEELTITIPLHPTTECSNHLSA